MCERKRNGGVACDIPPFAASARIIHSDVPCQQQPNQPNQVSCGRLALTPRYTPHACLPAWPPRNHFHSNVIKTKIKKTKVSPEAIGSFQPRHTLFLFSLWVKFILACAWVRCPPPLCLARLGPPSTIPS